MMGVPGRGIRNPYMQIRKNGESLFRARAQETDTLIKIQWFYMRYIPIGLYGLHAWDQYPARFPVLKLIYRKSRIFHV